MNVWLSFIILFIFFFIIFIAGLIFSYNAGYSKAIKIIQDEHQVWRDKFLYNLFGDLDDVDEDQEL